MTLTDNQTTQRKKTWTCNGTDWNGDSKDLWIRSSKVTAVTQTFVFTDIIIVFQCCQAHRSVVFLFCFSETFICCYSVPLAHSSTRHYIFFLLHKYILHYSPFPDHVIVQELCESRGGRPGLSVLTSLLVSVDVKIY